jgi:hypothetical protein
VALPGEALGSRDEEFFDCAFEELLLLGGPKNEKGLELVVLVACILNFKFPVLPL